jgi:hypothetical protein
MNRKQMCVANVRYKRPTTDDAKGTKNLLGYLTYRESRDEGVKLPAGVQRWTNYGMGGSVAELARRCNDLRSDHVLMFSLVINPNPQLIAMVPVEQRETFVRELTEATVEDFFEARGIDTGCEYSYVLHHRGTDDLEAPGMHNPHTHVVLPGTIWTEESGERVPLYFSQNKKVNHIDLLHNVTEQNMAQMMDVYVGRDWEQRFDALEAVRERERQVTKDEPHAYTMDDDSDIPRGVWVGTRRTNERTTAFGFYQQIPDQDGGVTVKRRTLFTPLLHGLPHDIAQLVAAHAEQQMEGSMDKLYAFVYAYLNATDAERIAFITELRQRASFDFNPASARAYSQEPESDRYTPPEPTLNIDF